MDGDECHSSWEPSLQSDVPWRPTPGLVASAVRVLALIELGVAIATRAMKTRLKQWLSRSRRPRKVEDLDVVLHKGSCRPD